MARSFVYTTYLANDDISFNMDTNAMLNNVGLSADLRNAIIKKIWFAGSFSKFYIKLPIY